MQDQQQIPEETLRPPSRNLDESTLMISTKLAKQIANFLTEIEDYNGSYLMQMLQNHVWRVNYPHRNCLGFHTVIAHFTEFKEKFANYGENKEEIDWVNYITKCMAFALRWNQVLLHNNTRSGRSLKALLGARIEALEKLLQDIDFNTENKDEIEIKEFEIEEFVTKEPKSSKQDSKNWWFF